MNIAGDMETRIVGFGLTQSDAMKDSSILSVVVSYRHHVWREERKYMPGCLNLICSTSRVLVLFCMITTSSLTYRHSVK